LIECCVHYKPIRQVAATILNVVNLQSVRVQDKVNTANC